MGIGISIGSYSFEAIDYGVSESSSPLAGNDTSGGVGSFDFTIPAPDLDLAGSQDTGWYWIKKYGPEYFIDAPVRLTDSYRGFTLGKITSYTQNSDGGIQYFADSRLGELNVYNLQAQPFVGTLQGVFEYYLSLVNITTDLFVDPVVASRTVAYPGWNGELWYNLKLIAAAQDCEIALVSGVIILRSIREREAARGRQVSVTRELPPQQLARSVEVYRYGNRQITAELVYPPNGWRPGFEIITVNAGETLTQTLQLSASVTSVNQPQPVANVVESEASASVYAITADDDTIISPTDWISNGGFVRADINPDTTSLTLTIGSPASLRKADGSAYRTFSIAQPSGRDGQRYSSLRILGTGVGFDKQKEVVPTSVPDSATANQVGITIDNPYVTDWDDVARVGIRAAMRFCGLQMEVSSTVLSINRRGDSGEATYPTYGEVQAALRSAISPTATYGQVQTYYLSTLSLPTYGAVAAYWLASVRDKFENQAFGNVGGARFWDKRTRRFYRIRSGDFDLDGIDTRAEDDLTHGDFESFYAGKTYAQIQSIFGAFDYRQAWRLGMIDS